uniref:Uncharacterized protein n=1 Tax=Sphaerodactylus townsendi TaxID=933632 RepID=A0ACB8FEP6_9SAUR
MHVMKGTSGYPTQDFWNYERTSDEELWIRARECRSPYLRWAAIPYSQRQGHSPHTCILQTTREAYSSQAGNQILAVASVPFRSSASVKEGQQYPERGCNMLCILQRHRYSARPTLLVDKMLLEHIPS